MDATDQNMEDAIGIQGFKRSLLRSVLIYLTVPLSGFTILLIFYWRPDLYLRLTHLPTDASLAEWVLITTKLNEKTVCRVYNQHLWSNRYSYLFCFNISNFRISRFRNRRNSRVTESSPISQEALIDGLPTSIKFFLYRNLKYVWNVDRNIFAPIQYILRFSD